MLCWENSGNYPVQNFKTISRGETQVTETEGKKKKVGARGSMSHGADKRSITRWEPYERSKAQGNFVSLKNCSYGWEESCHDKA